ncbi:lytic transglycosylase domain-containing protein [Candidatus Berkelbacteria bacterium]|nr:lytic transglycosylase domain-containing protein [Candidatus Berkelbacteria bacterium]
MENRFMQFVRNTVRNLVFAGIALPGLVTVPQDKLSRALALVAPKMPEIEVQKDARPELKLTVDFNAAIPVIAKDGAVTITWAKSNYDLKKAQPVVAGVKPEPDPSLEEKRALVQQIAQEKGIDSKILEAVWQVESGKSWNTGKKSGAGATGPAQFMAGTFRRYGEDYDGDGEANITDAHDSLAAAANLLVANGLKDGDVRGALLAYNHADWYVKQVLTVAGSIR